MFKVKHGLTSEVFEIMFVINDNSAQFRSKSYCCVRKINTEYSLKKVDRILRTSHMEISF